MNPWLLDLIVVHGGRVGGTERRSLSRDVERGLLIRVRRGVHVEAAAWLAMEPEQRHVVLARALAAVAPAPPVFSHWTAAVLLGLHDHLGLAGVVDTWSRRCRVAGEADGKQKYLDPRLATAGAGRAVYDEKRREDRVRAQVAGLARWGSQEAGSTSALGARRDPRGSRAPATGPAARPLRLDHGRPRRRAPPASSVRRRPERILSPPAASAPPPGGSHASWVDTTPADGVREPVSGVCAASGGLRCRWDGQERSAGARATGRRRRRRGAGPLSLPRPRSARATGI